MITALNIYTDDELLTRVYTKESVSPLEIELAQRLEDKIREYGELEMLYQQLVSSTEVV